MFEVIPMQCFVSYNACINGCVVYNVGMRVCSYLPTVTVLCANVLLAFPDYVCVVIHFDHIFKAHTDPTQFANATRFFYF